MYGWVGAWTPRVVYLKEKYRMKHQGDNGIMVLFFFNKSMCFVHVFALPVWFRILLGAKSVRGVICTNQLSLKAISKEKS